MRIEDCEVDGDLVASTAPFTRSEPETEWVKAKDAGIIPAAVFSLYERAAFLSFGSSPRFLSDNHQYLFSYFSMILESIKGTLIDADQELQAFVIAQSDIYDLGKEYRREWWDEKADGRAKNHFRMLILSLCSCLDATAELTAILLTEQIPGLRVGKAEFQRIEDWLKTPLPASGAMIVTPQESRLEELHRRLHPIVEATGPEKDWLPLMKLFRNKAAHLGIGHFREIGFHDKSLQFYRFFPRHWPVLWEEHIRSAPYSSKEPPLTLKTMLGQFMRQDNVSYVRGLRKKVTALIEAAFDILDSTYGEFKDFPLNQVALLQLEKNMKTFAFERFEEPV